MVNNILIIGITGNGKSALANTLSDTSNDNKFGEGNAAISQTKDSQKSDEFPWNEKSYRIIDNIGFGDTNNISEEDILLKIGEGIHSAKEGINQVLFVFGGRFGPEHAAAFNMFKGFISESGITKFTTLVRTNFSNFRNPEKCEADRQDLLKQNQELVEIISSCNGTIYVDNPPISAGTDERRAKLNKKKREDSRRIVLDHLAENCQKIYPFGEWNGIYVAVDNYIKEREKITESNSPTKEEELNKLKSEVTASIKLHLAKELPVAAIEYMKK